MPDENHLPRNTTDQGRELEHFRDEQTLESVLNDPQPSWDHEIPICV